MTQPGDLDDALLVEACLDGQQWAWDAVVDRYSRLVYAITLRYRLLPEDAAEVFQNVWLDLFRDLPNLRDAKALRSWLVTATLRRSLLHKRRGQKAVLRIEDRAVVASDDAPDPLDVHERAERARQVGFALRGLPDRCRELVEMLFFFEHPPIPYEEAARRLGLAGTRLRITVSVVNRYQRQRLR